MKIIEFGKKNEKVVILLHGGGLSWWNYKNVAEKLENDYHVVIPILNGHAGADKNFFSIEGNALDIINYIDKNYNGHVWFIGGLSLGGQILTEILSMRMSICDIAFIESALVVPMKLTHLLVKPMLDISFWLIRYKWFSKLQFKMLKINEELFEDYYNDTLGITKNDMIAFLRANSNYKLKEDISGTYAKVFIFVGEKESRKMIKSAKLLNSVIANSELIIKENLHHGELSINNADEYVEKIYQISK